MFILTAYQPCSPPRRLSSNTHRFRWSEEIRGGRRSSVAVARRRRFQHGQPVAFERARGRLAGLEGHCFVVAAGLGRSETIQRIRGANKDFSGGEGWGGKDHFLKIIQLH
jgi:hypothetical protein